MECDIQLKVILHKFKEVCIKNVFISYRKLMNWYLIEPNLERQVFIRAIRSFKIAIFKVAKFLIQGGTFNIGKFHTMICNL